MTSYFCDTSSIIKLYHSEVGSDWMESLFNQENAVMILSELTSAELYSAFTKKVRTGEITEIAKNEAIINFKKDCNEHFIITLLNTRILSFAQEIINKYGSKYSIRTLDAIQLSACMIEKIEDMNFVCADIRLIKICGFEGIKTINPEMEKSVF